MEKRKTWLLILLLLLCLDLEAQPQYAFRISFTDKDGAPPLSGASSFLSQRALDRRTQFGIPLDESDRPLSPVYLNAVLNLTESRLHVGSKWLNQCVVLLYDSSKILLLQGKPYISSINYIAYYPGGLHRPASNDVPTPTSSVSVKQKTTADPVFYGSAWAQISLLHGDCLHDLGFKGQDKLIAVLDDGFQYVNNAPGFDSLFHSGRIVDRHNFVLDTGEVYAYGSHGTQVLSTMAGYMPGNYVGAAPLAQYALYITEDITSEQAVEMDNFLAAAERADSLGADVLSSSLGYNYFSPPSPSLTYAALDGKTTVAAQAVNAAVQKGILCVITVGNEGGNAWNFILTPGDADSALTVGSVNNNKDVASNSGYGPNAAGLTKPNVCAQGNPASALSSGSFPFSLNGTSFATPQIAALAACLMQAQPGKTPFQLRQAIEKSSHLFNSPDNHAGYGVPDFCLALDYLGINDPERNISSVTLSPNPFRESLELSIMVQESGPAEIVVHDLAGRVILRNSRNLAKGNNRFSLSFPADAPSGFYLGRIIFETQTLPFKVIKE